MNAWPGSGNYNSLTVWTFFSLDILNALIDWKYLICIDIIPYIYIIDCTTCSVVQLEFIDKTK